MRKIEISNWNYDASKIPEEINCDAITIDLKTKANENSWWKIDKLEELKDMPAVIGSVFNMKSTVSVVAVPLEEVRSYCKIEQKEGVTAIIGYASHHYNLVDLNYGSLGNLAVLICKAFKSEGRCHSDLFPEFSEKIKILLRAKKVDVSKLNNDLKSRLGI